MRLPLATMNTEYVLHWRALATQALIRFHERDAHL